MRVLVIDNYDSFTYNLVQYLGRLGAEIEVIRNDRISAEDAMGRAPDRILISPGPGRPSDAGISRALIRLAAGNIPLLGVCLGHQCLAEVFAGRVVHAPAVCHGKTSRVVNDGRGVFYRLPKSIEAARYHSLVVDEASMPPVLEISARTEDGVVMGLRHRTLPLEGVQFHPESFMTPNGLDLLRNFLEGRVGGEA